VHGRNGRNGRNKLALLVVGCMLAATMVGCEDGPTGPKVTGPLGDAITQRLRALDNGISPELLGEAPSVLGDERLRLATAVPEGVPVPWQFQAELRTANGSRWTPPQQVVVSVADTAPGCLLRQSTSLPTITTTPGDPDEIRIPVEVAVDWRIGGLFADQPEDEFALGSVDQLINGAPADPAPTVQSFTMFPPVVETGHTRPALRFVIATVRLIARLDQTEQLDEESERRSCGIEPADVDRVEVSTRLQFQLPNFSLPLPTVLVLARHKRFEGGLLFLVPGRLDDFFKNQAPGSQEVADLWERVQPLFTVLQSQQETLSRLRDKVEAASWFLNLFAGLDLLDGIMRSGPEFRLTVLNQDPYLNQISNMNVDDPEDGAPYQEAFSLTTGTFNDVESEDAVSSLFLVGPGPQGVQFFSDQNFDSGEGQIDVVLGATGFFVAIPNLAFTSFAGPDIVDSASDLVSGRRTFGIGEVKPCEGAIDDDDYEDSFSSLRFAISADTCTKAGS